MAFEKRDLKKKSQDMSAWYTDVILKSELADYAPVKGCMVIRPYGYAIWEGIQKYLDGLIKFRGVQNAYFPLFIPESFLNKEKEHVEGFSPQMAVVTYAGGEELKEKLVVRPTSETVMYEMYKQWTRSYRDLPILINQWNNVVRWEKRTYLFLRTSEFLWQEGHCAHASHDESMEIVLWALKVYGDIYQNLLALYGVAGVKSESEKFAGAAKTYTYEMLMPDGKALQGCTSHDLGQNFAKAFDWTVLDKGGERLYPWQNSWGLSTRSIGGLVMGHGDDAGLVLPPKVAPIQVVIIMIPGSSESTYRFTKEITSKLEEAGVRVKWDVSENESAGYKFNKWELKGVPIRMEIGDKETTGDSVTVVRRDDGQKLLVSKGESSSVILSLIDRIQDSMLSKHKSFTEANTRRADSYDEFKKIMVGPKGFISAFWCESPECELKIKEETKASNRCLPLSAKEEKGKCVYCGKEAKYRWLFAQAY